MLLSSALAAKPRLRGRSLSAGELAALTLGLTALVLPAATSTGAHVTRDVAYLSELLHGIAYCERKLGDYPAAESAYLKSLALAPTADSHFLLAQFEDTQQSAKAREHARRAMLLAPSRYQKQGEELIDKLVAVHFGCLGAFRAEGQPLTGRGAFAAP